MGLIEAKLRKLEHPTADPVEVSDIILEADGQVPHVRIDITDPPSPVIAHLGERGKLAASAANADEATRALGREVAKAERLKAAKE